MIRNGERVSIDISTTTLSSLSLIYSGKFISRYCEIEELEVIKT